MSHEGFLWVVNGERWCIFITYHSTTHASWLCNRVKTGEHVGMKIALTLRKEWYRCRSFLLSSPVFFPERVRFTIWIYYQQSAINRKLTNDVGNSLSVVSRWSVNRWELCLTLVSSKNSSSDDFDTRSLPSNAEKGYSIRRIRNGGWSPFFRIVHFSPTDRD